MTLPVANREYVIITKTLKNHTFHLEKYTGKCDGEYADGIHWLFFDVARVKTPYHVKPIKIFTIWDEYIEITEMNKILEKAKQARQNMEKRSLNIVLKRLVNENFEWS
jgi:hypothetical protein